MSFEEQTQVKIGKLTLGLHVVRVLVAVSDYMHTGRIGHGPCLAERESALSLGTQFEYAQK